MYKKKSKYGAIPVNVNGIRFASKAEAKRYGELRLLERAGVIEHLNVQPRFDFVINGMNCGFYKGDFSYFENGVRIVEDVKGGPTATAVYRLKAKLVKALYHLDVREVRA